MNKTKRVRCEIDREWDISGQKYVGRKIIDGTLLEISTQTIKCEKTNIEKITPVGIVLVEEMISDCNPNCTTQIGSFESVPVEFMTCIDEFGKWEDFA